MLMMLALRFAELVLRLCQTGSGCVSLNGFSADADDARTAVR